MAADALRSREVAANEMFHDSPNSNIQINVQTSAIQEGNTNTRDLFKTLEKLMTSEQSNGGNTDRCPGVWKAAGFREA